MRFTGRGCDPAALANTGLIAVLLVPRAKARGCAGLLNHRLGYVVNGP